MKLQTDKNAALSYWVVETHTHTQWNASENRFYGEKKTKSSHIKHSNIGRSPRFAGWCKQPIWANEGACIGIIQWNCKHLFLHIAAQLTTEDNEPTQWIYTELRESHGTRVRIRRRIYGGMGDFCLVHRMKCSCFYAIIAPKYALRLLSRWW